MTFPQQTITDYPAGACAGLPYGGVDAVTVASCIANEAIAAGDAVSKGSTWDAVEKPDSDSEITNRFRGVAMYTAAHTPTGTANEYASGAVVPVVTEGPVWVTAGDTMTDDTQAFLGNNGAYLGKWYTDAQSGNATEVGGVWCRKGAAAAGLALIELNLV